MSPECDKQQIVDASSVPPLEGDLVKEGKGIKTLTPKQLLTRLLVFLAQIKAKFNSY